MLVNEKNNFIFSLLQDFPNTYAYTKNVAEDAVKDLGRNLPIAVYRPSISKYQKIHNFFLYSLVTAF